MSGSTWNRERALLSAALKWARAERDYAVDPAILAGLGRPENPARERRLKPGELERLLEHAGPMLGAIITLCIETAMRRGELTGLQWRDVDLQRGVVTLRQTKNGDKLALVPLSSRAVEAFRQLPRGIGDAPVVPIHHDVLSHRFVECCRAAGITGLRLHDLRAECVSRLFEKGLTLPEVRAISRHKSTALLRYVRHADVEGLRAKLG